MAIMSFEIGTTTSLTNVEALTTTPNMAPRSKFLAYAETAEMDSGVVVGRGSQMAIWTW